MSTPKTSPGTKQRSGDNVEVGPVMVFVVLDVEVVVVLVLVISLWLVVVLVLVVVSNRSNRLTLWGVMYLSM